MSHNAHLAKAVIGEGKDKGTEIGNYDPYFETK
jgi:hypothetical protein